MLDQKVNRHGVLGISLALSCGAWIVSYFGARVLLAAGTPDDTALRLALACVPVVAAAVTLGVVRRVIAGLDEMAVRIQLEALATAFVLTALLLMAVSMVQLAEPGLLQHTSLTDLWVSMPPLYFIGLAIATRRYS